MVPENYVPKSFTMSEFSAVKLEQTPENGYTTANMEIRADEMARNSRVTYCPIAVEDIRDVSLHW